MFISQIRTFEHSYSMYNVYSLFEHYFCFLYILINFINFCLYLCVSHLLNKGNLPTYLLNYLVIYHPPNTDFDIFHTNFSNILTTIDLDKFKKDPLICWVTLIQIS